MKTVPLNLYEYKELSTEAKEKALKEYRNSNDYPFLDEELKEKCKELLEKHNIKTVDGPKLFYSLSFSQGDGVMFEGEFIDGKYTVYVKHHGHYYHKRSASFEVQETDNLGEHVENEKVEKAFIDMYEDICNDLEKAGYKHIEVEDSEETFIEACEANEWTFEVNGVMRNA